MRTVNGSAGTHAIQRWPCCVARTTIVEDAWERGQDLQIHSWIYRLDTGRISVLDAPIRADR